MTLFLRVLYSGGAFLTGALWIVGLLFILNLPGMYFLFVGPVFALLSVVLGSFFFWCRERARRLA